MVRVFYWKYTCNAKPATLNRFNEHASKGLCEVMSLVVGFGRWMWLCPQPEHLRKQWALELEEKFHLPCVLLDAKTYRQSQKGGNPNPFLVEGIVICSIHFASRRASEVRAIQWDLAVIDEAHKLRNAYRQSNRMGQNIRWALEDRDEYGGRWCKVALFDNIPYTFKRSWPLTIRFEN